MFGRPLSAKEKAELDKLYAQDKNGDGKITDDERSLDYSKIHILRKTLASTGASRTLGNDINMEEGYTDEKGNWVPYFNEDGSLTTKGM